MENKELHKLSKELERFCVDNNIEKAKSGYLMGLFVKHTQALSIANVVGESEQCSGCEESTGETKLWCCNHCGKRVEHF